MSTIQFGKHAGKRWDEIPTNYLQWVANDNSGNGENENAQIAKRELEERGVMPPGPKINFTAINAASLNCLDKFNERADKSKGIHSWLAMILKIAMSFGEKISETEIEHDGLIFKIQEGELFPTLISVREKK